MGRHRAPQARIPKSLVAASLHMWTTAVVSRSTVRWRWDEWNDDDDDDDDVAGDDPVFFCWELKGSDDSQRDSTHCHCRGYGALSSFVSNKILSRSLQGGQRHWFQS